MDLLKLVLNRDIGCKNISDTFLDKMKYDGVVTGKDIVGNLSGAIIDYIPGIKTSILSEMNLRCIKVIDVYKEGCRCVCLNGIEDDLTCGDLISLKFKRSSVLSIVSYINMIDKTCDLVVGDSFKKIKKGTYGYFDRDVVSLDKDIYLTTHIKEDLSHYVALKCLRSLSLSNKENKLPLKIFTVLTPNYKSFVKSALYKIDPIVSIILSTIILNDCSKGSSLLDIKKGPIVSYSDVNNLVLIKAFLDTSKEINIGSQVDYTECLVKNSSDIKVVNGGIATIEIGIPVYKYGNSFVFSSNTLDSSSKIISSMCLKISAINSFV